MCADRHPPGQGTASLQGYDWTPKKQGGQPLSRELWALGKRVKGAKVQDQSLQPLPAQEIASGVAFELGRGGVMAPRVVGEDGKVTLCVLFLCHTKCAECPTHRLTRTEA